MGEGGGGGGGDRKKVVREMVKKNVMKGIVKMKQNNGKAM